MTVLSVVVQPRFCWYTAEHGKTRTVKEECLVEVQRLGMTDCFNSAFLVKWVDAQIDAYEDWNMEDEPTGNPANPWLAVQKDIEMLSKVRGEQTLQKEIKRHSSKKETEKKKGSERVRNHVSYFVRFALFR